MWFALPWLAISLPLLTSVRLRLEFAYDSEATIDGALALARLGGPYFALLGLWFGLRPNRRAEGRPVLNQGSGPMLVLLGVAVLSMALLLPFDVESTRGPWRMLFAWLGAAALPAWAAALLLRERGVPRPQAAGWSIGLVVLLASGSVAAGSYLLLDPWAQVLPLSAAGLIAAAGCVLAAWERVTSRTSSVLAATAGTSLCLALLAAWQVAHPPMASGRIVHVEAIDQHSGRSAVAVRWPNVQPLSMIEIDLRQGDWAPLPALTRQVRYATGVRVTVRLGRLGHALGRVGPAWICREVPGDPSADRCGPSLPTSPRTLIGMHPRLPRVLASWRDRFVVWNVEEDDWIEIVREGERLRWPCFDASGGVIWRLLQAEGPYKHERLRPDGRVVHLELGHDFQCIESISVTPAARFERGRGHIGKPSMLYGDGLPEGGLELAGHVQQAAWSGDGGTAAFHVEENDGRYTVRFWQRDVGLSESVPAEGITNLLLSTDGTLVAWPVVSNGRREAYEVRSVPDGALVDRGPLDSSAMAWSAAGRLLLHQDGRMLWRDPRSGIDELLFPSE